MKCREGRNCWEITHLFASDTLILAHHQGSLRKLNNMYLGVRYWTHNAADALHNQQKRAGRDDNRRVSCYT